MLSLTLCCAVLCRLHSVVSAAWQLHARRLKLAAESVDGLSPTLTHMRVVREAAAQLDDLTARWAVVVCGVSE